MSVLNGKTTKTTEYNTCQTSDFNKTLLTILEEEGGLVITSVKNKNLEFRYIKYSKFKFTKRNYRNSRPSAVQQKKGFRQYKKTIYIRTKTTISSIKKFNNGASKNIRLFAVRV